jgi:DHA1 family bicyclomycin/chloramphenicol resistance-like MFS transporter
VLHDGTAVPMATVITLCGVLAVSLAVVTRRAQQKRDALIPHNDVRI